MLGWGFGSNPKQYQIWFESDTAATTLENVTRYNVGASTAHPYCAHGNGPGTGGFRHDAAGTAAFHGEGGA